MKKGIVLLGVIGTFMLASGLAAMAATGMGQNSGKGMVGDRGRGCRLDGPGHSMTRLLDKLDLTADQQQQVDKLIAAHVDKAKKLRSQMVDARGKLRQAMDPQSFDEKALRQAAAEKNRVQVELMVDKARTHSQIYALLTAEQQELADLARNLKRLKGDGPKGFHRGAHPRGDCPYPGGVDSPKGQN